MKITIVGAGRVGIHLAKYFAAEQQDVFLVDNDTRVLAALDADFNLRTVVGEPTDFNALRDARAADADIFVAVTAGAAENLVACALAKSMGAKMTIARVDRYDYHLPRNEAVVRRMGVDHVVYPDFLAAQSVLSSLEHGWSNGWAEFENGSIVMVALAVADGSPMAGLRLRDIFRENRAMHVSALRRNHVTIIPGGDDRICPGDVIYVTSAPDALADVRLMAGVKPSAIKKVILMGGSAMARLVANLGDKKFEFTIVEKNRERCRQLMQECADADIICGDGSETDVLDEAGIDKCDAFVALTDNTESNILSCLTAADSGVRKTVCEVEKEQLLAKAESFRIDSIINKPIVTATSIFQLILGSDIDSSKYFVLPDAEVGRLKVKPGSFLTKNDVMNLKLPHGVAFAGMTRDGRGQMVTGATRFREGDTVIVFSLPGTLSKVEKMFGK